MPAWASTALDRILLGRPDPLDLLWAEPGRVMAAAGMTPDPWQEALLRSGSERVLLLCTRQAGKSTATAALALRAALLEAPALVLLLSPTLRQSGELFRDKVLRLYHALGRPVPPARETALSLELENGSRLVSLPENESGIRGFSSVSLLVIDEASRVSEGLYRAVRPMLAVSGGRLVALSTPFGKRGWFFEEWERGPAAGWERYTVTAFDCPRISRAFLAEEERSLGPRWFRQEYLCSFEDAVDAVFSHEHVQASLTDDVEPYWS